MQWQEEEQKPAGSFLLYFVKKSKSFFKKVNKKTESSNMSF